MTLVLLMRFCGPCENPDAEYGDEGNGDAVEQTVRHGGTYLDTPTWLKPLSVKMTAPVTERERSDAK